MQVYCDNAATTVVKPPAVATAVYQALAGGDLGNPARGAHDYSLNSYRAVSSVREKISRLLRASAAYEVVFTNNATTALNMLLKGLFQAGDHLLTTSWEHNAVLRPLYQLEEQGVSCDFINSLPVTGQLNYHEFEEKRQPQTKAVILNHASNVTGNLADLDWIKAFCRQHQLLLILDISQSCGQSPLDLSDELISAVCFTGHKSLYGPTGTGGICLKRDLSVAPLITGGDGLFSFEKLPPPEYPAFLEAGTLNVAGIIGLGAGLDYLEQVSVKTIQAHGDQLITAFTEGLQEIPGIIQYGDLTRPRLPVTALNIRNDGSDIVSDLLWRDYRIATRPGFHCAPRLHQALQTERQGAVRFSFSHLNTLAEVDYCLAALAEISRR